MLTIWKTPLYPSSDEHVVELPHPAKPLCVQMQPVRNVSVSSFSAPTALPTVWWVVDTEATERAHYTITRIGTGWELPPECASAPYLGTVQELQGTFVWHFFLTGIAVIH